METQSMISGFNGDYRFLSNFWPCHIDFEGIVYPTVEHAYQAAKTTNDLIRMDISTAPNPSYAKKLGRTIPIREDWEDVKVSIMRTLLRKKFYEPTLMAALQATGDSHLEELNYWHDIFWGKCSCEKHKSLGENWLGKLLMEIRSGS